MTDELSLNRKPENIIKRLIMELEDGTDYIVTGPDVIGFDITTPLVLDTERKGMMEPFIKAVGPEEITLKLRVWRSFRNVRSTPERKIPKKLGSRQLKLPEHK